MADSDTLTRDPVVEPPRMGKGATKEAWQHYAIAIGVGVHSEMGRDAIIAAVDAARADETPAEGAEGDGDAPAAPAGEQEATSAEAHEEGTPKAEDPTPEPQPEARQETVTFEVRGVDAPDFARGNSPYTHKPKKGLVVKAGPRKIEFQDGRYTTSDPAEIALLDDLAAKHSDGTVVEYDKRLPTGEVVTRMKWDAYGHIREDPTRNNFGIVRVA